MGLIRFLFLLLIIWVLWFMAKNWLRKQELQAKARNEKARNEKSAIATGKVVRCKHCEIHLPEQEALRDGESWFCSPAHKQAWLDKPGNSNNDMNTPPKH